MSLCSPYNSSKTRVIVGWTMENSKTLIFLSLARASLNQKLSTYPTFLLLLLPCQKCCKETHFLSSQHVFLLILVPSILQLLLLLLLGRVSVLFYVQNMSFRCSSGSEINLLLLPLQKSCNNCKSSNSKDTSQ